MNTYQYINHLANRQRRKFSRLALPDHLNPSQGKILHFLLRSKDREIFQRDIEAEFGLRPPSATAMLKDMEAAGLITRTSSETDARRKKIIPTSKAARYEKELLLSMDELDRKLTENISDEELAAWKKVTAQMIKNLEDR